ncbi:MAG TPA: phosphate regulon transcriptional regulatory protein PhoB [Gammaproteobacteria bacterium]|nr:phosphate regulon transcriptional regulatory protein PhoB [Gammaproteobacteria bacterium]
MTQEILLVEDESAIREMLQFALQQSDYAVQHAEDAQQAMDKLSNGAIDLILLDWMLPGISGVELCRRLKRDKNYQKIPIIMLTARAEEDDKIQGLNAGADDYLTKPFSPRELMARINAVLRRVRSNKASDKICEYGGLVLNEYSHRVTSNQVTIELGPTEYRLLQFFMTHPERVFSRAQLLDNVWGTNVYVEERTVDVHVRRLRKSLEETKHDKLVQTVRGAGYRFSSS